MSVGETEHRRYGAISFAAVFLVSVALCILTLASTIPALLLGALLAALAAPLRDRLAPRLKSATFASAVVTTLMLLGVLIPLGILFGLLLDRAIHMVELAPEWMKKLQDGALQQWMKETPMLSRLIPKNLPEQGTAAIAWFGKQIPNLVGAMVEGGLAFFLTILTTYYFLRDGSWILGRLERVLPLEPRHVRAIADEFPKVGRAVFVGTLGTAGIQAALAGVGYWLLDVPEPLLLGSLTFLAALLPIVGSAAVWAPVAIYLVISGEPARAGILCLLGILVIGTVDNVVRPVLTRGGLRVHPLLMFLGLFGALTVFGASGLFLGPLFVALFMTLARIYVREFAPAATSEVPVVELVPESSLGGGIAERLFRTTMRRKAQQQGPGSAPPK